MLLLCLVGSSLNVPAMTGKLPNSGKIWKTINPSPPPHRGHWPAIAYHKDPKQTELREPAGYLCSFSLRNCRAASATSCQPLSKTREWPRPGCTVEADRPGGSPGVELEGRLLMS